MFGNWTRRSFLLATAALPTLAQSRLSPAQLGANTAIAGYDLFESLRLLEELDFPAVEIHPMGRPQATPGRFPGFESDRVDEDFKRRLRTALEPFRAVTAHLPYTDLHTLSPFEPIAEFSRGRVELAIQAAGSFGCRIGVLHPDPGRGLSEKRAEEERLRLYREWGDLAKAQGMRLALETGFPSSVDAFVRLVEQIDHSHLGATIDVGHQARYEELSQIAPEDRATPEAIGAYNDVTLELIRRLGPKTFHLHVHDIEPASWAEHKPLEHGFVDYPRLFDALEAINYDGLLIFEIGGDPKQMPEYLAEGKRKLEALMAKREG